MSDILSLECEVRSGIRLYPHSDITDDADKHTQESLIARKGTRVHLYATARLAAFNNHSH